MDKKELPTIKDKNIFWSGVGINALTSLIGAFFIGSFFYLSSTYFNYGVLVHLFIFFDSGLLLIIIILYSKKKITKIQK